MDKILITNDQLKANALKAYQENRLTAQYEYGACHYRQQIGDLACCCVIGASLPPDFELVWGEMTLTVGILVKRRQEISFEDIDFAERLQQEHDSWCRAPTSLSKKHYEHRLLEMLHEYRKNYNQHHSVTVRPVAC